MMLNSEAMITPAWYVLVMLMKTLSLVKVGALMPHRAL